MYTRSRIAVLATVLVTFQTSFAQSKSYSTAIGDIRCETCLSLHEARPPQALFEGFSSGLRGVSPCGDDGDTIDVLFVYTAAARIEAGGVGGVNVAIQDAIANINQTLADSQAGNVQFRAVNQREVNYDEFAGNPSGGLIHLQRLSEPADGFMDEVHGWRNQDRADLVALIVATGNNYFGGVAWAYVYDPSSGFSCCDLLSAQQGTFTHEWGHNLGLFHQCEDLSGYLRYARGYLWNNSQSGVPWATAMVGASTPCPRPPNVVYIPRYSNPDLFYQGERTGIPLNQPGATHEALAIRETHYAVANFRRSTDATDCNANGIDDATDIANLTSADVNLNGRPDECESRLYVNINTPNDGDGASWATARRSLVEALRVAALPCSNVREIWVARGTYKPDSGSGDRSRAFELGGSVMVYGGFVGNEASLALRNPAANETILSGDIGVAGNVADNTFSVVVSRNSGPGALLDGVVITDGRADFDAGGIYLENAYATIRGCLIWNNHANGSGGGAAANFGGGPRFEDCTFRDNSSDNGGGGLSSYQSSGLRLARCTFLENSADWGSAISLNAATNAQFEDSIFTANVSAVYTGAVDQFDSSTTFIDCIFGNNVAVTYGGGLLVSGGSASISDTSFVSNTAADWGGGLAAFGAASISLDNCNISLNSGTDLGGGMTIAGLNTCASLRDCFIWGNTSAAGGGVSAYDQANVKLDRCVFLDNTGTNAGGGIDASFSPVVYVSRSRFLGNQSAAGAGISTNNATLTVVNSEFSGNAAGAGGGGGIALYLGSTNVSSSTFTANSSTPAGGAIYAWSAPFTMTNSIAWGDTPAEFGLFAGATASVSYSDVQGGAAGAGNLNVNPQLYIPLGLDGLVGTADDDLRLRFTSQLIDAGNTNLIPPDVLDLDADLNVVEATPRDLDNRPRAYDDANRPNSGVGIPPVDMGAHEAQPAACPGDLDGDNQVSLTDLAILLSNFGRTSGVDDSFGDIDLDGDVDLTDLAQLLARFGSTC